MEATTIVLRVIHCQRRCHNGTHHLHLVRTREGASHRLSWDLHLTIKESERPPRGPRLVPLRGEIPHLWHRAHHLIHKLQKYVWLHKLTYRSSTKRMTITVSGCTIRLRGGCATCIQNGITPTTMCTDRGPVACHATFQREWTGTTADTNWQVTSNSTSAVQSSQTNDRGQPLVRHRPGHDHEVPHLPSTLVTRSLLWVQTS